MTVAGFARGSGFRAAVDFAERSTRMRLNFAAPAESSRARSSTASWGGRGTGSCVKAPWPSE